MNPILTVKPVALVRLLEDPATKPQIWTNRPSGLQIPMLAVAMMGGTLQQCDGQVFIPSETQDDSLPYYDLALWEVADPDGGKHEIVNILSKAMQSENLGEILERSFKAAVSMLTGLKDAPFISVTDGKLVVPSSDVINQLLNSEILPDWPEDTQRVHADKVLQEVMRATGNQLPREAFRIQGLDPV